MQACPRCRATYPDDVTTCPEDGASLLPSGMLAPVDAPLEPGTMVGEYRVDRKLGAGTFGDVYAGEQPVIGKRVAIKLLHRKLSSDAEVVSRFVAEARAVNRIRHRHIIDIFSFGMLGDHRHYFVMELLDGLTLGELLEREKRLPLDVALPIFRGIASALDAAHEAGITHRDLKPDNVFLAVEKDGSYFPKLLDFGVAKLAGEDVAHRTATGIAIGTPRYMSPEQCRGKKVDRKADIYSLGALVHEVLTGKPLFDGDGTMDVFFKHTSEAPTPMSHVCPDLPSDLDAPVLAMLAKKPKDRPDSAGAAIRDLIERARAAGQAATMPVSSQSVRHIVRPVSEDRSVDRLPPDAATVAVRARPPIPSADAPATTPDTAGPALTAPSGEAPGAAAVSVDVSSLAVAESGRGSTEIAPASRVSGTLLSDGPEPAALETKPGPTMRSPAIPEPEASLAKPAPAPAPTAEQRPRPSPWAMIALVAIAVAGVAFGLRSALAPSSSDSAGPSGSAASAAPSPPPTASASSTALPAPTSTAMEVAAPGMEAPASTTAAPSTSAPTAVRPSPTASARGKPLATPAPHHDLEPPPELDPKKR
jgi:serine/threonine protein kinase